MRAEEIKENDYASKKDRTMKRTRGKEKIIDGVSEFL